MQTLVAPREAPTHSESPPPPRVRDRHWVGLVRLLGAEILVVALAAAIVGDDGDRRTDSRRSGWQHRSRGYVRKLGGLRCHLRLIYRGERDLDGARFFSIEPDRTRRHLVSVSVDRQSGPHSGRHSTANQWCRSHTVFGLGGDPAAAVSDRTARDPCRRFDHRLVERAKPRQLVGFAHQQLNWPDLPGHGAVQLVKFLRRLD